MKKCRHEAVNHSIGRYIKGKHNIRPLSTIEQMGVTFDGLKGKRLMYRELVS